MTTKDYYKKLVMQSLAELEQLSIKELKTACSIMWSIAKKQTQTTPKEA